MDFEVVVENVRNLTTGAGKHGGGVAGVRLDVDGLDWVVELDVRELHVADAVVFVGGRDRADRHSKAEVNIDVTNDDVLGAGRIRVPTVTGLDGDSVVEVGDVKALDQDVRASRVQTVSVEREPREGHSIEACVAIGSKQKFAELELSHVVNVDLKVVAVEGVDVLDREEELGGVDEADARDFDIGAATDVEHLRSVIAVELKDLTNPPHVALAIYGAVTLEYDVVHLVELPEVLDVAIVVLRPPVVSLGELNSSI